MANSFERIYAVVKKIPRGTVASYGQVALLAGNPRWARVVGYALHANPDPEGIPCYRVVTKDGRTSPAFAFGGADIQRALLEADGIEFTEDGVVRGLALSDAGRPPHLGPGQALVPQRPGLRPHRRGPPPRRR